MKSKHDAIKEFNCAFNRYWRAEWINAQHRKYLSNEKYEEFHHKLDSKWEKLIEMKVSPNECKIFDQFIAGDYPPPWIADSKLQELYWLTLAVTKQCRYFYEFPHRKDFWFLRSKLK